MSAMGIQLDGCRQWLSPWFSPLSPSSLIPDQGDQAIHTDAKEDLENKKLIQKS
jgi:hypothetical protein